MYYTESEIVGSYVRSGRKASQITVLAELNAESTHDESVREARKTIIGILEKNGVLKAPKIDTRGMRKPAPDTPKVEKKLLPALIPPKVKIFDSPVRVVNYWRWETGEITDKKVVVKMTAERLKPERAAVAEDAAQEPDKEKPKQAAGEQEIHEHTAEEFRKGFLFMANFVADCITAMDEIDPNAPDADKQRAAYIKDIEDVQQFLSKARIKRDDDTSNDNGAGTQPEGI